MFLLRESPWYWSIAGSSSQHPPAFAFICWFSWVESIVYCLRTQRWCTGHSSNSRPSATGPKSDALTTEHPCLQQINRVRIRNQEVTTITRISVLKWRYRNRCSCRSLISEKDGYLSLHRWPSLENLGRGSKRRRMPIRDAGFEYDPKSIIKRILRNHEDEAARFGDHSGRRSLWRLCYLFRLFSRICSTQRHGVNM